MASPTAAVLAAEPDHPARPRRDRRGPLVLLLGALATLAAVAFGLAPVTQPQVTYAWSAADGAAALPLMPYQPVALTADVTCDAARAAAPGTVLLATVPPDPDPRAQPLPGLRVARTGGGVDVTSAGVDLGTATLPAGPCTLTLASDPQATRFTADGTVLLARAGDVRPSVAGLFSQLGAGVTVSTTADTRFQTTITPGKAAVAAVGVAALLAMLVVLARIDRAFGRRVRLLPRGWWRPRLADLAVTAVLAVWWVVGAVTVDDGYIAGIVRSRGENGFIGNVYRWLNAPEAPFSWFYDVFYGWAQVSPSTVWLRLPSTLLGLACWALLSRGLLPRLGRRVSPWVAALGLLAWWVPLNLGLRPEPWVATGLLATTVLVERAVATRRLLPLVTGLLVAGVTTALTPGGLVAFVPFLAGLVPVLRVLRARRDLRVGPLVAALVAAPAAAAFLAFDDQSLAATLESIRVRDLIGGGLPWYGEYERYANLLAPDSFQGSIGRRAAVLGTLVAVAGLLWAARRWRGLPAGPATRLGVGILLTLAVMTFTPTKWTQHFGDLAGTGAAALAAAAAAWAGPALRRRPRAFLAGLGAATAVGTVVLTGDNLWPFVSAWFTPSFATVSPRLGPLALWALLAAAGGATVAVLGARRAWARSGDRPLTGIPLPGIPARVPGPVPVLLTVLTLVVALQVGSLARVAAAHPGSYTLASDAVATAGGDPCGLERDLSVETDPAAGLLPARPGPAPDAGPEREVDAGGTTLPGVAVDGHRTSAWYDLTAAQRAGTLPVVVTTSGSLRPGDGARLEFGAGDRVLASTPVTTSDERDVRALAPRGADGVRLVLDGAPGGSALVSLPRAPQLTPMERLLPRGTDAVLDWPVAFVLPCLNPAPLPLGTASVPQWRIGPPLSDPSAGITYAPSFGGPFAGPRLLVTERRMPAYLAGDPVRDPVQVYRWTPVMPLATLRPTVLDREVPGWAAKGHARVPGLDPPGR